MTAAPSRPFVSTRRRPGAAGGSLLLAAVCAVVLTGCLRGTVDVAVDDDGAGRVELEVFPDSDLQRQIEGLDVASLASGPAGSSDLELTRVERDGREGYRLEFSFADAQALGAGLTSGIVVGGQQVTLFDTFQLRELDYGAWKLEATISPAGELISRPAPGGSTEVAALVDQLTATSSQVGLELTVTLPGKVISSNAAKDSGGSATWKLDDADSPTTLRMETEAAPLLSRGQLIVAGGVLALIVGVLLAMFGSSGRGRMKGRRRRGRLAFPGPSPAAGSWAPPSDWAPPPSSSTPKG